MINHLPLNGLSTKSVLSDGFSYIKQQFRDQLIFIFEYLTYHLRTNFTTKLNIFLIFQGYPTKIDKNRIFYWEEIFLFQTMVKFFNCCYEWSKDKESFFSISSSSYKETLILEVTYHIDKFVLPVLNIIFANPRIDFSIKISNFKRLIISYTFSNLLPS